MLPKNRLRRLNKQRCVQQNGVCYKTTTSTRRRTFLRSSNFLYSLVKFCLAVYVVVSSFVMVHFYSKNMAKHSNAVKEQELLLRSQTGGYVDPRKVVLSTLSYACESSSQKLELYHAEYSTQTNSNTAEPSSHRRIHHGQVLEEFLQRTLSRSIAQSNVMIVSPDITRSASLAASLKISLDPMEIDTICSGYSQTVIAHALAEGHETHLVPSHQDLNHWWTELKVKQQNPNWFLMAYFVGGRSGGERYDENAYDQDNADSSPSWKLDLDLDASYIYEEKRESIDDILHPSRVGNLLKEATLTYIVIEIHAEIYKSENDEEGESFRSTGLTAVETLLNSNYKLQLLASSHFYGGYHPNHLFKTTKEVEICLKEGATFASKISKDAPKLEMLLFATQGLDLAIPSRLSYLNLHSLDECKSTNSTISGRCDSKLNANAMGQEIFLSCPKRHEDIEISFNQSSQEDIIINLKGELFDADRSQIDVWFSHKNKKLAEAVCATLDQGVGRTRVSCATRILPRMGMALPPLTGAATLSTDTKRPQYNVLSILIDPISRSQLRRSLPNTASLLDTMGFVHFKRYTTVGDNSGPNQAALYTGKPLAGGRDGIKSSTSHNDTSTKWLWDVFNAEGYVTLKSEDGCIENSNMVQSIKPKTMHGEQIQQMFCKDFDRPNCLGRDLAANHLLNYTQQFMHTYSYSKEAPKPWAAFLSFVDSHEDSISLISYLDEALFNFIQEIDLDKTVIIFSSDHGLHYGPTFASNGKRERTEPVLHIHVPKDLEASSIRLNGKEDFYVTAFDVHETILDAVGIQKDVTGGREALGTSLLRNLDSTKRKNCHKTPGIPERYCKMYNERPKHVSKCTFMNQPPSALSFFADIRRDRRPAWPKCIKETRNEVDNATCNCTTVGQDENVWKTCSDLKHSDDPVRLKTCKLDDRYTMEVDINVKRDERIINRYKDKNESFLKKVPRVLSKYQKWRASILEKSAAFSPKSLPNILFLEVDSVSRSAAIRHMPKTMSFLNSHQMKREGGKAVCPTGFCAAMFNKTSVVGQNSIPNQLAALSGCSDLKQDDTGIPSHEWRHEDTNVKFAYQTHCPTKDIRNPWLFDIVRDLGYVDFFGDEFCYKNSPYVVQGNYFSLNATYDMNSLFCPLTNAIASQTEIVRSKRTIWSVDHDSATNPKPCVDGRSRQEFAFEFIKGMYNAYPDVPKFAYLNTLAAHDYSIDLGLQPLGLEAYDDYLSVFLAEMLARPDAQNTVIVLRSDHGLQGGPSPIDFSTQVEHMNPFNNLIIPSKLNGVSLQRLFYNQDKLVTGYDLYKTLRALVRRPVRSSSSLSKFSYNLLKEEVPAGRTCSDAKIPVSYCPCIEERDDLMPYFYIGHSENTAYQKNELVYNPRERKFNAVSFPGKFLKKEVSLLNLNMKSNPEKNDCHIDSRSEAFVDGDFHPLWNDIDNITSSYPNPRLSGGLFLYPKQVMYFRNLILNKIEERKVIYGRQDIKYTICETGFGAGHSAAFFLSLSPEIQVLSFDKFDRPYQLQVLKDLQRKYPGRIHHVQGNSCSTVPSFFQSSNSTNWKCDFLHGSSLCPTDNLDLVRYAGGEKPKNCKVSRILTSTAMSSIHDRNVYFGPNAQWRKLREAGCITDITCFKEEKRSTKGKFIFAKKGMTYFQHSFCLGRITGYCHHSNENKSYELQEDERNDPLSICKKRRWDIIRDMCRIRQLPLPK